VESRSSKDLPQRTVVIGRALKPFGTRGEIRIRAYTESLYAFEKSSVLFFGEEPYNVLGISSHKGILLAKLQGVDSREEAAKLTGSPVKTTQDNLPPKEEDEFYWFELIGMKVQTMDGLDLGTISQIIPTKANHVICVEGPRGEVLLPMIEQVVKDVDTLNGIMVVDPLEGLIPDA